jgi:hypothetical protein
VVDVLVLLEKLGELGHGLAVHGCQLFRDLLVFVTVLLHYVLHRQLHLHEPDFRGVGCMVGFLARP